MKTFLKLFTGTALCIAAIILLTSLKEKNADIKQLIGAWEYGPAEKHNVMIVTDKIFSVATYDLPGKKFIGSYGGTWQVNGNKLTANLEWHSADSTMVGRTITSDVELTGNKLNLKQTNETWNRVDDGSPGELMGAWIITGNYTNDKASKRANPFYPRRTMKVLSGKRFHWIAYNVATKTFMNAGGGTYSTNNGKYTENVEFFTKTPESVGKTLVFDYSFVDGDWRHKGQKSTGGAMDECWSKRETLEK